MPFFLSALFVCPRTWTISLCLRDWLLGRYPAFLLRELFKDIVYRGTTSSKLAVVQIGVEAAFLQESFVCALFDNVTVVHDQDQVRITDC